MAKNDARRPTEGPQSLVAIHRAAYVTGDRELFVPSCASCAMSTVSSCALPGGRRCRRGQQHDATCPQPEPAPGTRPRPARRLTRGWYIQSGGLPIGVLAGGPWRPCERAACRSWPTLSGDSSVGVDLIDFLAGTSGDQGRQNNGRRRQAFFRRGLPPGRHSAWRYRTWPRSRPGGDFHITDPSMTAREARLFGWLACWRRAPRGRNRRRIPVVGQFGGDGGIGVGTLGCGVGTANYGRELCVGGSGGGDLQKYPGNNARKTKT